MAFVSCWLWWNLGSALGANGGVVLKKSSIRVCLPVKQHRSGKNETLSSVTIHQNTGFEITAQSCSINFDYLLEIPPLFYSVSKRSTLISRKLFSKLFVAFGFVCLRFHFTHIKNRLCVVSSYFSFGAGKFMDHFT